MTPLEVFGVLLLTILVYRVLRWLLTLFYNLLAPNFGMSVKLPSMGKWAVITGATDGVGKAFADELAEQGMNIVLISRSQDKLESVAAGIEEEFKVQTKIIVADFTGGSEVYEKIEKQLIGLEVGVLVNNVGISYSYPEYFLDIKDKEKLFDDIFRCNMYSVVSMCRVIMPAMVERNKGVVINVSSTAADIPSPLLTVYSASKIFVSKFSKDLGTEYKKDNIVVQCLTPGYVATKMSKIRKATWMAPSPRTYVKSAVKTVGILSHTTGYYPHSLLLASLDAMECISTRLAEWMVINQMKNIRSRSLRKAAALASTSD